eukprot:17769-Eustigmatos_ZCMA.PRE.1
MFSEHCGDAFSVEPVDVVYEADGRTETTPLLTTREETASLRDIRGYVGVELDPELVCQLCDKMQLGPARYDGATESVTVSVPPTR